MRTESIITIAIALIATIYSDYTTIKLIYNITKGRILLNKAKNNGERIVRGISTIYKASNYLFSILMELFFIYTMIYILRAFGSISKFLSIFITMDIIVIVIVLIIHIIATFAEKYVYLTKDGLIYFSGHFDFDKCRHVWEAESQSDALSNRLHIYKPNDNNPYTVYFEEQLETEIAHKLID